MSAIFATSDTVWPRPLVLCLLLVALPSLATVAAAQPPDPTVELALSYYAPTFDTKIQLDSADLGTGTRLELESDLGVEDSASELRGELAIRLGRRFGLVVDHVAFQRSGSGTLSESVQFGDVLYAASAELDATVESRHTGGALKFSFVKSERADIALSLGVSFLEVSASIAGLASATANGEPVGSSGIEEKGDASGPVPLVGLHGAWWLADRLRLRIDGRYMNLETFFDSKDQWSGSMTELAAGVDWFALPWLAIGGGYASTSISADFDDGDLSGSVDYSFDGFRVTTTLVF